MFIMYNKYNIRRRGLLALTGREEVSSAHAPATFQPIWRVINHRDTDQYGQSTGFIYKSMQRKKNKEILFLI